MKRGGKVISVADVPELQMALKDLGGRRLLAVALWFMSSRIRARARRAGVAYRYYFMHPSGDDLALLADLIDQGKLNVIELRSILRRAAELWPLTRALTSHGRDGRAEARLLR